MNLRRKQAASAYANIFYGRGRYLLVGGIIALIFFLWLLLNDFKAAAEHEAMDLMLRNMRVGMQVAKMQAGLDAPSAHQQKQPTWAGSNPVRWLGSTPANYQGECSSETRRTLAKSTWCFDIQRGEVVFRPRSAGSLQALPGQPNDCRELSWRVLRPQGSYANALDGWRIDPVGGCRWR